MTRMCRCGSRNANLVEVIYGGTTVKVGRLCRPCLAEAMAKFATLKEQFEELLSLGVNRDLANEVIIERINAMPERPEAVA